MPAYIRLFSFINKLGLLILLIISSNYGSAQDCVSDFQLSPVLGNNSIEWKKFPEFTLPFKIIYNGPRFNDNESLPLRYGFSHLAAFSGPEATSLPAKNRALLWNSVATMEGTQPWSILGLESPWGNDTLAYYRYWDMYLKGLANLFQDSRPLNYPLADIICMDIERIQELDRDILALKRDDRIPQGYRSLADNAFLLTYKKDIKWWYTEPAKYIRKLGLPTTTALTSYSDVPVRGTWLNVPSNSWQDWTTNPDRTHYLLQDDQGKIGGSFANQMDILTPSAYYFYPYENPLGKDYLSYLLFQIEANRAWSDKDIIPFVWLRYHNSFVPEMSLIPKFMAEATAIFPFFSGAKGLWLWENNFFEGNEQQNYATYEHFIHGLYRLSQFSDMFEGDHELVIPQSARDHMTQRNPIWRGVVKDGKIVIAAQNTYATETSKTPIRVAYKNWSRTIELTGRDVFLCKFDLSDIVTSLDSSLNEAVVFPNPTKSSFFVNLISSDNSETVLFELFDLKGVLLRSSTVKAVPGQVRYQFDLPDLKRGTYLVKLSTDNNSVTHTLLID